jgi:exosortase A-associated hydrolase 1
LVIVGGPQYRVGSHRQFVHLSRWLAQAGIPVFRFDYRGMGDSEGEAVDFEQIQQDIRAAVDHFSSQVPGLRRVVLWGLCDAASAALFYAHTDERVAGLVLLNPWVRTEEGIAKAYLKHYYLTRLVDPSFWRKVRRGEFDLSASIRSLTNLVSSALSSNKDPSAGKGTEPASGPSAGPSEHGDGGTGPLPDRMLEGLRRYRGRVLMILSGDDITASEFKDVVNGSRRWRKQLRVAGVERKDIKEANHTFSRREWRDQVARWTEEWVKSLS